MHIEHIGIYVADLEAAKQFYVRYFEGTAGDNYHNPRTGFTSCFIRFDSGARIELMHKDSVHQPAPTGHLGFGHLSLRVGSQQGVDQLTNRLREDGYAVLSEPRTTGDGYYESLIAGVEGHPIEILT